MPKTSRPDRKRNDRGTREPSEFAEATLSVDRVTRVVKGGRRMRFRAVVIVGNKKGKVGLGTGKATEVQAAVKKAVVDAKRHMVRVPLVNGTIPHEVNLKHKAARIRLMPASEGTGILAGGALRVVLEHAGVKDVLSKRFGSNNKLVNAQAVMKALELLKPVRAEAIVEAKGDQLEVRTVSRDQVVEGGLTDSGEQAAPKAPQYTGKNLRGPIKRERGDRGGRGERKDRK